MQPPEQMNTKLHLHMKALRALNLGRSGLHKLAHNIRSAFSEPHISLSKFSFAHTCKI